jgi:hypothetical protein
MLEGYEPRSHFQNPTEHQERAGEMKEAAVGCEQTVMAYRQSAEVAEPPDRTFDDPPSLLARADEVIACPEKAGASRGC